MDVRFSMAYNKNPESRQQQQHTKNGGLCQVAIPDKHTVSTPPFRGTGRGRVGIGFTVTGEGREKQHKRNAWIGVSPLA